MQVFIPIEIGCFKDGNLTKKLVNFPVDYTVSSVNEKIKGLIGECKVFYKGKVLTQSNKSLSELNMQPFEKMMTFEKE